MERPPVVLGERPAGGKVIFLNGVSSAGKSSLGRALQAVLEAPSLYVAMDHFEAMAPPLPPDSPAWASLYDTHLFPAMHRCAAAFAAGGATVVVDTLLLKHIWLQDALRRLGELPVIFVGVRCALPELERRERERGDRPLGHASGQLPHLEAVCPPGSYDLEVDTTHRSPKECALEIKRYLEAGPSPAAFRRLRVAASMGGAPGERKTPSR